MTTAIVSHVDALALCCRLLNRHAISFVPVVTVMATAMVAAIAMVVMASVMAAITMVFTTAAVVMTAVAMVVVAATVVMAVVVARTTVVAMVAVVTVMANGEAMMASSITRTMYRNLITWVVVGRHADLIEAWASDWCRCCHNVTSMSVRCRVRRCWALCDAVSVFSRSVIAVHLMTTTMVQMSEIVAYVQLSRIVNVDALFSIHRGETSWFSKANVSAMCVVRADIEALSVCMSVWCKTIPFMYIGEVSVTVISSN